MSEWIIEILIRLTLFFLWPLIAIGLIAIGTMIALYVWIAILFVSMNVDKDVIDIEF